LVLLSFEVIGSDLSNGQTVGSPGTFVVDDQLRVLSAKKRINVFGDYLDAQLLASASFGAASPITTLLTWRVSSPTTRPRTSFLLLSPRSFGLKPTPPESIALFLAPP